MKSYTLCRTAGLFLYSLLIAYSSRSQVVSVASGSWTNPATWSTGALPSAGDDVIIRHAITVSNVAFNATVRSLTLENGTLNTAATLSFNSGTAIRNLHILGNLSVTATTNNNCRFQLQGASTACAVDGDILLTRNHPGFVDAFGLSIRSGSSMTATNLSINYMNSSDDNQEVYVRENSSLVLTGDVSVTSTGGSEEPSIDVVDDAYLECRHFGMLLALPEAPSGVGRDAELRIWNNGRVVVHGNFTASRRGGRRIMITIGNSAPAQASLLVEGDMLLEHFDGLNHTNKDLPITVIDQCSLTVRGNLTAHSTSARALNFSFSGSSRLDVDGLVSLTGSTNTNLTMNALNTSQFFFGGDIVMSFPLLPNPNVFSFAATSPNISTVTFDGTANQTVPGAETYGNLVIDNPLHVTLAGNITVNNHLNLVNGKVIAATRVVTLPLNANISGSSTAYICNGRLSRGLNTGAGPYWFYLGDTAKGYSPVTLSNLSATSTFDVTYFPVDPGTASYPSTSKVVTLDKVSNLEYWTIDRVSGTGAAQVALGWNVYSAVNGSALNQLRVAHWDGTRWTNTGPVVYTGNANAGIVRTVMDIPSFSPFTLASTGPDNFIILPLRVFEEQRSKTTTEEESPVTGLRIYPNPAISNEVSIILPDCPREIFHLLLMDVSGQIMHEAYIPSGNGKYRLPVKHLPKGLYLVQVRYAGRKLTSKLILH